MAHHGRQSRWILPALAGALLTASPAQAQRWDELQSGTCSTAGYRTWYARLWDVSGDWKQVCEQTPASVENFYFESPTRCVDKGIAGLWGEFDVPDWTCGRGGESTEVLRPEWECGWECMEEICNFNDMTLCTRDEMCVGDDRIREGAPLSGDVWMSVGDHSNAWISMGTANPDRTCKLHEQVASSAPTWGLSTGPKPVTGVPGAARCCPRPSDSTRWSMDRYIRTNVPVGDGRLLGPFDVDAPTQTATRTSADLPPHTRVRVTATLVVLDAAGSFAVNWAVKQGQTVLISDLVVPHVHAADAAGRTFYCDARYVQHEQAYQMTILGETTNIHPCWKTKVAEFEHSASTLDLTIGHDLFYDPGEGEERPVGTPIVVAWDVKVEALP